MREPYRRVARVALAAVTLLASGCATASYPTRETARRTAPTQIRVRNHNWSDMAVYALKDDHRVRVGTVGTGRTVRLRLPTRLDASAAALKLEANPLGSDERFVSQPIYVERGAVLNWTIENHIELSSFYVTSR